MSAAVDIRDGKRKIPKVGIEFAERPIGSTGTRHSGNRIIGDEHNTRMVGPELVRRAEYMRRTEPTVMRVIGLVRGTTTAVSMVLEGGDQSTEFGRSVYAACEAQLGLGRFHGRGMMARNLDAVLDPFHAYWYVGHGLGELTRYADYCPDGVFEDGSRPAMHWLGDVHHIEPSSVEYWHTRDFRTLDAIEQRPVNWGEPVQRIPAKRLFLVTWQKTGSNWAGLGAARVMSWWVDAKEKIGTYMVRAVERLGNGIPKVHLDLSQLETLGMTIESDEVQAWINDLAAGARKMKAGKLGAYVQDNTAVSLQSYGVTDLQADTWIKLLSATDDQIAAPMGANFMFLGLNGTGSRAVGQVLGGFFRRQCVEIVDVLVAAFTDGPLRTFVEWNFGADGVRVMPALGHVGLDVDRTSEALPMLPQLNRENLLVERDEDTEQVREIKRRIRESVGLQTAGTGTQHQRANARALQAVEALASRAYVSDSAVQAVGAPGV